MKKLSFYYKGNYKGSIKFRSWKLDYLEIRSWLISQGEGGRTNGIKIGKYMFYSLGSLITFINTGAIKNG